MPVVRPFFGETHGSGERVVRPVGDLTAVSAAALRRSVAVPLSRGAARIVLDLSLTRRIDTNGRAALVECSRAVRAANGTLVLVCAPDAVRSFLRDVDAGPRPEDVAGDHEHDVDDLSTERRRLESAYGRRVCAAFASRSTAGQPLLCVLPIGHVGTHECHELGRRTG